MSKSAQPQGRFHNPKVGSSILPPATNISQYHPTALAQYIVCFCRAWPKLHYFNISAGSPVCVAYRRIKNLDDPRNEPMGRPGLTAFPGASPAQLPAVRLKPSSVQREPCSLVRTHLFSHVPHDFRNLCNRPSRATPFSLLAHIVLSCASMFMLLFVGQSARPTGEIHSSTPTTGFAS
jgi:hypothetical protein